MTQLSDDAPPPKTPLMRLPDYVTYFARSQPERDAVVHKGMRLTYGELDEQVRRCAQFLQSKGVQSGDRVAMIANPSAAYWIVLLATMEIGAIWVGLNPKYKGDELAYQIRDCSPCLLICLTNSEDIDSKSVLADFLDGISGVQETILFDESEHSNESLSATLENVARVGSHPSSETMGVSPNDPALIVYTSGSTGAPKGALISHKSLCVGSTLQSGHFGVSLPRVVCNLPINHVGCVADICATTLVRGGLLIFQDRFDPEEMMFAMDTERATIWPGVPTMFQIILEKVNLEELELSSVELILWGGAAMPKHIIEQLRRFGARLMTAYGMTETTCHVMFTADGASIEELSTTIGRPDNQTPCRIVTFDGSVASIGEAGELQIGGNLNFLGYFRRPDETKTMFTEDHWLKSGDIARRRADGAYELVGRMKDMFKSGGYNVYPREIECVLESHPQIKMAAVVATPDELFQEIGHAFVVASDGGLSEADLRAFLKNRIANYKIPKTISFRSDLPKLPIGKIDKTRLKAEALTLAGSKKL